MSALRKVSTGLFLALQEGIGVVMLMWAAKGNQSREGSNVVVWDLRRLKTNHAAAVLRGGLARGELQ